MAALPEVSPPPPQPDWSSGGYFTNSPTSQQTPQFGTSLSTRKPTYYAHQMNLFDHLDLEKHGYISIGVLESYWEGLGIDNTGQVLCDLGLKVSQKKVDLNQLSIMLFEEISQYQEIVSFPTVKAGLVSFLHEVLSVKSAMENVTMERDKLRTDLKETNHRTSLLVIEIDEQNVRQEKETTVQLQMIEQRCMEHIKELKRKAAKEQETSQSSTDNLKRRLIDSHTKFQVMELSLKEKIDNLKKENDLLKEKNKEGQKILDSLKKEKNNIITLKARLMYLENIAAKSNSENNTVIKEENSILEGENQQLKDKNDELVKSIELLGHGVLYLNELLTSNRNDLAMIGNIHEAGKSPSVSSNSEHSRSQTQITKVLISEKPESEFDVDQKILNTHLNIEKSLKTNHDINFDLLDVKSDIMQILSRNKLFINGNETLRSTKITCLELQKQNEELRRKLAKLENIHIHYDEGPSETLPDIVMTQNGMLGKINSNTGNLSAKVCGKGTEDETCQEIFSNGENPAKKETEKKIETEIAGTMQLLQENQQLEECLTLMKVEFESMEDYWQKKLNEERRVHDDQLRSNEKQFGELDMRMKEYEDLLLAAERGDTDNEKYSDPDSDKLSMIEERREEEEQVNVWEQEISELRKHIIEIEKKHQIELLSIKERFFKELSEHKRNTGNINQTLNPYFQKSKSSGKYSMSIIGKTKEKLNFGQNMKLNILEQSDQSNSKSQTMEKGKEKNVMKKSLTFERKLTNKTNNEESPFIKTYRDILSDIQHEKKDLEQQLKAQPMPADSSLVQQRLANQVNRCRQVQSALANKRADSDKNIAASRAQHQTEMIKLESLVDTSQSVMLRQNRKFMKEIDNLTLTNKKIEQLMEQNLSLTKELNILIKSLNKLK